MQEVLKIIHSANVSTPLKGIFVSCCLCRRICPYCSGISHRLMYIVRGAFNRTDIMTPLLPGTSSAIPLLPTGVSGRPALRQV